MIVRFVNIGGIIDHHCLNILFVIGVENRPLLMPYIFYRSIIPRRRTKEFSVTIGLHGRI